MTTGERALLAGSLLSALGVRLALIHAYPANFSMDGYQRWAGREHLLIQDWLPATQSIVHAVSSLGGGILEVRYALALVAALAVAAGAMAARELGGLLAGWLFVPLALFGPFLTWSVVPYQEGTYLLTVLSSVALVLRAKRQGLGPEHPAWLVADLLAGATALVRYEGWIFILVYMVWRRDKRVLRAAWGAAFWLGIKSSGIQSYAASPIDFADWGGITDRFSSTDLSRTLSKLGRHAADTWLWLPGALGLVGAGVMWRRKTTGLWIVLLLLGLQLVATLGWMIGLETATYRMQAIPGVLLGLLGASGVGLLLQGRSPVLAGIALLLAGATSLHFVPQAHNNAKRATRSVKWEQRLAKKMNACEDCRWAITPRRRIGSRDRHDGCEIIQGLGDFKHGVDFWCTTWPGAAPFSPTHRARWQKGGYRVEGD
jgi:hypothetical protein